MSTQFQTVREIFFSALEREADAREAYVAEACAGKGDLLEQVKLLLEAHVDGTGLLDRAIQPERTIFKEAALEKPGSQIGPYKLLQEIGHGGMGVVYMAEQHEPVRRKVALKIIKPGMDTRQVIARFEAERQALSLMDHPNIARVLDAGTTESGRPYFAMELVKGQPITEYCDAKHLTPRQRLELLVPVCQAIQHAHQKGIIHRDIKPSNILVAEYDQQTVPKVIDFGVAKATSTPLTEKTMFTGFGQIVGTLEYMSPEQAKVNQLDIDTRSDVYSLGVVMYELLTGSTPFDKQRLRSAAWHEMLRIIREEEPPKPSTRLSESKGSLSSISAQRQIEPGKLTNLVRGELDWIVMKALEKERSRRYETANGLARDIERYLHSEAIEAAPPTAGYRIKKLFRKHRAAVTTAAAFALLLVLGTMVSVWQAVRATIAEGHAEQSLQAEATQRKLAEKARDRTRDVLDAMTSEAMKDSISTQGEVSDDQKKFLNEVLTYYQEFAGEKAEDEESRARTADAAFRVGEIEWRLGRREQGIAAMQKAREGYRTLASDFAAKPNYRARLALSQAKLARLLTEIGKPVEAEEQARKALLIAQNLSAEFPSKPEYRELVSIAHDGLFTILSLSGRSEDAEVQYPQLVAGLQKMAARFPGVPVFRQNLAGTLYNLALNQLYAGKPEQVERICREALSIEEKLCTDFPADPSHRKLLAATLRVLHHPLMELGKHYEAEEQCRRALEVQEKLARDFPAVPDYRRDLGLSHNYLGVVLQVMGRYEEAEDQYRKSLQLAEKLNADFPNVSFYQLNLGETCCNYGVLANECGRGTESLSWFEKANTVLDKVRQSERQNPHAREWLCNTFEGRAEAYDALAKFDEAIADWDRALELCLPAEQLGLRAGRATSRLRAGFDAEAVAEVEGLLTSAAETGDASDNSRKPKRDGWYRCACFYSLASTKIPEKQKEYADRAMELLERAVKAGWKEEFALAKCADLDALREREDFKKLASSLEPEHTAHSK